MALKNSYEPPSASFCFARALSDLQHQTRSIQHTGCRKTLCCRSGCAGLAHHVSLPHALSSISSGFPAFPGRSPRLHDRSKSTDGYVYAVCSIGSFDLLHCCLLLMEEKPLSTVFHSPPSKGEDQSALHVFLLGVINDMIWAGLEKGSSSSASAKPPSWCPSQSVD